MVFKRGTPTFFSQVPTILNVWGYMRILMFNRVRQASKNWNLIAFSCILGEKNILFIDIVIFNGYHILSCLSSHKIWRMKFRKKMLLPYVCSTVNLLLNKKLAKKTVLQFEKELQLNTYFELQFVKHKVKYSEIRIWEGN